MSPSLRSGIPSEFDKNVLSLGGLESILGKEYMTFVLDMWIKCGELTMYCRSNNYVDFDAKCLGLS